MYFARQFCLSLLALACALGSVTVFAQSMDKIKTELQKQFGSSAQIKSISPGPIPGLFEVVANNTVLYTDAQARYLIQGSIVDLKTGINLTDARESDLNQIKFSELPLKDTIKIVRGDGSRVIAIFADPNCGYCKVLEKNIQTIDNISVHTFLMPILSADSTAKSKAIWCASDMGKAWTSWMVDKVTPTGKTDCTNPLERNLALAKKLGVSGTPAIFFTDGTRIPGAVSKDSIEKKLAELVQKK